MITEFLVGLVGNIVASYIYDSVKGKDSELPPLVLIAQPGTIPSKQGTQTKTVTYDHRALNRERARRLFVLLFFFAATLYILGCAIFIPLFLSQGFSSTSEMFNLGEIKIIGLFTDAEIPFSYVRNFAITATVFLYLPILLVGDRLLVTVKKWYDKFWPVTFLAWIGLRTGTFVFLSLILAGFVTYLVTELSLIWALATPFIVAFALWLYAESNS